jgi:hypothetical protein
MERLPSWRALRSWLGLLALLVLATGGPTFRAIHGILVPHRVCEVHGAVEHASDEPGDLHASVGPETADERAPALSVTTPDAAHAACSFSDLARVEPGLVVPAAVEIAAVRWTAAPEIAARDARCAPIPLLALAPKHSPPA